MAREQDPFANPVGQTISRVLEPLWDGLVDSPEISRLKPLLDDVLRIRAVQTFKPSEALAFVFVIKRVVREELGASRLDRVLLAELLVFESRVDELAKLAFDSYLGFREKIYEIRATELRSRSQRVLEKLNRRLDEKTRPDPSAPPSEVEPPTEDEDGAGASGDKRGGTT